MPTHHRRPTSLRRAIVLAPVLVLAVAVPVATGQEPEWPMVGGDPSHTASAPEGPAPPYRRTWTAQVDAMAGPVVSGGVAVVVGEASVTGIDAGSGEVRWDARRPEGPAGPAAIAGDVVVHGSGRGARAAIVGRGLEDGLQRWRFSTGAAALGGPAVAGDHVYVGVRTGEVVALDAETGDEAWRFEAEGRVETAPAVAGERVVAVSENYRNGRATVSALDAETGEREWAFAAQGATVGTSSPSILGETVFVGMGDGEVRGIDLGTGRERWSTRVLVAAFSARAFTADTVPATAEDLVITDIAHVYRIDADSGEERWSFRIPELITHGSPVVSGDAVAVGDDAGGASAIDLATGERVWRGSVGSGPVGAVAAAGDRLFLASFGTPGTMVALEHDPAGTLLAEASQSELLPARALLNFAAALVLVGAGILVLFRVALPAAVRATGGRLGLEDRGSEPPREDSS